MKNSAAVPSGAAEKRDLTKLMLIIFARYLASLTVYVASSQSAPLYLGCAHSARPLPRGFTGHVARPIRSIHHALLCRSTRRVMSRRACDDSGVVATRVCVGRVRGFNVTRGLL